MLKRNSRFLLVSLLTLLIFVLLFTFRSADDNRLTSWQWAFEAARPAVVFFVLFACVSLSLLFLKVTSSPRFPSLLLFFAAFVAAALFWEIPEVIVDASRYFTQAKHLELYGIGYFFREWGDSIMAWTDLPLVPFLYGMVFRLFDETRLYVQIFTTLMFSTTVVLTYLIGKELWDEETGLLGGAFLLGIPYLFSQVPLMLADVPTMFFLTLAIFTFIKGIEQGGWMMVCSALSLFLALFSKYSTWPMLSVLVVITAVYLMEGSAQDRKDRLQRALFMIAAALLMAGAVVLYKRDVFAGQMRLLFTFQEPGLKKWGESVLSTFFFQVHPFLTIAALYSFYAAARKRDGRHVIISWLVILLLAFQVKRIRYTLPLFPMIALMASYGLQKVRDRELRRFIVLCAVISSLTVAVLAYRPFLEKMSLGNLQKAGKFLDTMEGKDAEVIILPQQNAVLNPAIAVPMLDLYTRKNIIYHYDPRLFPHAEEVATSPLRFTWEYRDPAYYGREIGYGERSVPLVILSAEPGKTLPKDVQERLRGYRFLREFDTYEGVYDFRAVATVYAAESHALSQTGAK